MILTRKDAIRYVHVTAQIPHIYMPHIPIHKVREDASDCFGAKNQPRAANICQ
jgi:hypothetical protein